MFLEDAGEELMRVLSLEIFLEFWTFELSFERLKIKREGERGRLFEVRKMGYGRGNDDKMKF